MTAVLDNSVFSDNFGGTAPTTESDAIFPTPTVSEADATRLGSMAHLADISLSGVDAATPAEDYAATIQRAGTDTGIRQKLVQKEKAQHVKIAIDTAVPHVGSQEATDLVLQSVKHFEKTGKYESIQDVIERNAAKTLIDNGLVTDQVAEAQQLLDNGVFSSNARLEKIMAVVAVMDNVSGQLAQAYEDQPWWSKLGDLAAYMIPFYVPLTDFNVKGSRDHALSSAEINANFAHFMSLSPDDQIAYVHDFKTRFDANKDGYGRNILLAMDQFKKLTDKGAFAGAEQNLYDLLDITIFGKPISGFFKSVTAAAAVAKNAKAVEEISVSTIKAMSEGAAVASKEEAKAATSSALPTAINPTGVETIPVSAKVQNTLNRIEADLVDAGDVFKRDKLTSKAEQDRAVEVAVNRVKRELLLKDTKAVDVKVLEDKGTQRVTVSFGHGKDNLSGYGSAEAAKRGAARKGIDVGHYTVGRIQGKYFINVERDVGETNIINAVNTDLTADTLYSSIPFIQFVGGAKSLLNADLSSLSELSRRALQKSISRVGRALKSINTLGSKGIARHNEVLKYGKEREVWFDTPELHSVYQTLFGRTASDKEIIAYHAHRLVSDFNFKLMNDEVFKELVRADFQEVKINQIGLEANGKIVKGVNNPETISAIHMSNSGETTLYDTGELTHSTLEKLMDAPKEDPVMVKMVSPVELSTGEKIEYAIVPRREASFGVLRPQQLNYRAGGSTIYRGKNFVKQVRIVKTATGKSVRKNDRTHFAIVSKSEAKETAENYNMALDAFKKAEKSGAPEDVAVATDIIHSNTYFKDFDEFKAAIESGKIERTRFEVVRDRNAIKDNTGAIERLDSDFEQFTDQTQELLTRGRLWFSKRGDQLKHPLEQLAPTLSPTETLSKGITAAVRTNAFSDFQARAVESWVSKYGVYLDNLDASSSPAQRFFNGQFRADSTLSPSEKHAAEVARVTLKRTLQTPTMSQREGRLLQQRLAEFLDKKGAKALAEKLDGDAITPISLAKGIAFKLTLGLGDLSQLVLQVSMFPSVIAAYPVHGLRALGALPWLKLAHRFPSLGKLWAELAFLTSGMSAKQFAELMADIRKSGVGLIGSTQALLDDFTKLSVGVSTPVRVVKNTTDALSYFFNTTERANQYLGYTIAWLKEGGTSLKDADKISRVTNLSEALAGNMSSASNAFWQKGLLSIPTQFQSFMFKQGEIMAGILGNGTSGGLKGAAAARYTAMSALVYGANGVPFATYVYHKLQDNSPDGQVSREQHIALTSGLSGLLFQSTDLQRLSPYGGTDIVQDLFDPNKSFLEIATGRIGDMLADGARGIVGAAMLAKVTFGHKSADDLGLKFEDAKIVASEFVRDLASNVSSLSRAQKAFIAYHYGLYLTKHGDVIDTVTAKQSLGVLLGLNPRSARDSYEAGYDITKKQKVWSEEATRIAGPLKAAIATQDADKIVEAAKLVGLYMRIITNETDRYQIMKMVMNKVQVAKNLKEDVAKKVYMVFGVDQILRRLEYKEDQ